MNTPWTLRITDGDSPTTDVPAVDGLTIGRHPDCDLTLSDSRVSGRHAKLVAKDGGFAIVDLGSNNGTGVDGGHVLGKDQEQRLSNGMRLQLGHAEILVMGPAGSEATDVADADQTLPGSTDLPGANGSVDPDITMMAPEPPPAVAQPKPQPQPQPQPKPQPEPEPKAAPAPAKEQPKPAAPRPPAVPADDESFGPFDSVELNTIVAHGDELFGGQAKLSSMGARVVLLNEADLRIVSVDDVEFTIGRSSNSNVNLGNRGVSNQHARIVFVAADNRFMIEDLGSANGTQVDGAPLTPNAPMELGSDAHVRFGTVEAVFMKSLDTDFHELPASRHENATKLLKARGLVSANVLKQAAKDAAANQQTIGEALLLAQHVSGRDWCRAVRDAHVASTVSALSGDSSKKGWVILLVILLAALGLLFGLPEGREWVNGLMDKLSGSSS